MFGLLKCELNVLQSIFVLVLWFQFVLLFGNKEFKVGATAKYTVPFESAFRFMS